MRKIVSMFIFTLIMLCALWVTAGAHGFQMSPVFGPETFTRESGAPQAVTRDFSVQDPSADYTLIIRSGQDGAGRVSSATVDVNGIRVAGPSDFSQQVGLIIKPVSLQQQNTIAVVVRGQPGSSLTVTIQKGSALARLTIIDNRTDPLLMKAEYTDGKVVDYFGDRDAEGLPTSIYAVRVQHADGNASTYYFDEQQRLTRVAAANGVFFEFNWLSDTSVAMTATAPNGDQIDVPIDLPSMTAGQPTVSSAAQEPAGSTLGGFAPDSVERAVIQQAAAGDSTSLVTVRHCSEPVNNARVELEVRPERGDAQQYVYKPIGNGVYSLTFPNRDTGGDQRLGNRLCFAVTKVLDKLCAGLQGTPPAVLIGAVCPALSIGAVFLGVPPPLFIAACALIAEDLDALCIVEGSFGDICELNRVVTNRIVRGRLSLNITARMPGISSPEFASLGSPVNGVYPPVTIVFPCACEGGYGKRFVVNEDNTDVKVTILPFEAAFTDEIRLFYRGQSRLIGTNRDVGRVVDLGRFGAGEELVFGIFVRETGRTFRMGPGSRNPDRYAHARVDCLSSGVKVSFEDNFLGEGDRDFDDAVIRITTQW
ncbi:MAG TPA: hypothetical protein VNZ44_05195 [Pyrinomonadaceae bacterium]|nr:hypothetical protein [Pyrinomonadaceae bacterium]